MWRYNNTNEIYHHGILGQKWGVRRYQNKDGSLTPAGKRKAAKMKEEYTQLTGKRLIRKPTKKATPSDVGTENVDRKQMKGMTNTEIQNRIDRLQKEKQLTGLQNETASKGEKFVKSVATDVLAPAAIEAGKRVLTSWFEKQGKTLFGLDSKETKTALEKLKEEAEISKAKRTIQENENWFKGEETRTNSKKQKEDKTEEAKSKFVGNIYDKDTKVRKPTKDVVIDVEDDVKPNSTSLVPYRRRK